MIQERKITDWFDEIDMVTGYMRPHHDEWKKLYDSYGLKFDHIRGMKRLAIVKASMKYPQVRKVIAGIAFHYPRMFFQAEPLVESPTVDLSTASATAERGANKALQLMKAKREVHQGMFDMLFTSCGWLKQGYNYGKTDTDTPYTANDRMRNDFPYVSRRSSNLIFVSPLTAPHNLGTAPYVLERMFIPWMFIKDDPAIENDVKALLDPTSGDDGNSEPKLGELSEWGRSPSTAEQEEHKKAKTGGKIVELWEIHDRYNRMVYWVSRKSPDKWVKRMIDPFVAVDAKWTETATGERVLQSLTPINGSIMEDGFPYIPIKIDTDPDSFYTTPPIKYIDDLERLVVESMSRRADNLRRFSRIAKLKRSEEESNKGTKDRVKQAGDGDAILLDDLKSLEAMEWGDGPADQNQIQADAEALAAEALDIGSPTLQGSQRKTATEVSTNNATSTMNREWLQMAIGEVYEIITRNNLRMFRDPRFLPGDFIVNLSPEQNTLQNYKLLLRDDFLFEFSIDIDTGSMQPLIAQLERDEVILLYDRLINNPHIDTLELTKELLRGFRKANPEQLLKGRGAVEATRAAQMENAGFLLVLANPGVLPEQDHPVHMQEHAEVRFLQMPEFRQLEQEKQGQVMQMVQVHLQQHQQAADEKAQNPFGSHPEVDRKLLTSSKDEISQVRKMGQEFFQIASNKELKATGQTA